MTEGEMLIQAMRRLCDGQEMEVDGYLYKIDKRGLLFRLSTDEDWTLSGRSLDWMLRLKPTMSQPEQPTTHVRRVEL